MRRRKFTELAQGEHMLDKTTPAGMMDAFCGRCDLVGGSHARIGEDSLEQHAQMRIPNLGDGLLQLGKHLLGIALRAGEKVREIDLMVFQAAQAVYGGVSFWAACGVPLATGGFWTMWLRGRRVEGWFRRQCI